MTLQYPIDNTKNTSSIKLNKNGSMTAMYYDLGTCEEPSSSSSSTSTSSSSSSNPCKIPLIILGNPNIPLDIVNSPPNGIKKIVGGKNHTCILHDWDNIRGSVSCYGFIERFKLKESDYCDSTTPLSQFNDETIQTYFSGPGDYYIDIDSSDYHICAISATDNSVICYGEGDGEGCGRGRDNSYGQSIVPADISSCKQIVTGKYHTCALKSNNMIQCWGAGTSGEENPNYGQSTVPPGVTNCQQIFSGDYHTCVLKSDNSIECWGKNLQNQLDITGNTGLDIDAENYLSLGKNHSCFIKNDLNLVKNLVVCKGSNFYNQTTQYTLNSIHDYLISIKHPINNIIKIISNNNSNCILYGFYDTEKQETNYSVYCWGKDEENINIPNIRYSNIWGFSDYIILQQNEINCEPIIQKSCNEYKFNESESIFSNIVGCVSPSCCEPLDWLDCLNLIPSTKNPKTGKDQCMWNFTGNNSLQLSSLKLGDREQIFKVYNGCSAKFSKFVRSECSLGNLEIDYDYNGTLTVFKSRIDGDLISFEGPIPLYESLYDLQNGGPTIPQLISTKRTKNSVGYFKLSPEPNFDSMVIKMVGDVTVSKNPLPGGIDCRDSTEKDIDITIKIGAILEMTEKTCLGAPGHERSTCKLITQGNRGMGWSTWNAEQGVRNVGWENIGDQITTPLWLGQPNEIQNFSAGRLHLLFQDRDFSKPDGYGPKGFLHGLGAGTKTNCSTDFVYFEPGSPFNRQCGCESENLLNASLICDYDIDFEPYNLCDWPTSYGCIVNRGQGYIPNQFKQLDVTNIYDISAGGLNSCIITDYNALQKCVICWGQWGLDPINMGVPMPDIAGLIIPVNRHPQYDSITGDLTGYANKFYVVSPDSFKSISVGGIHGCGIKLDNSVFCWGNNDDNKVNGPYGAYAKQIVCSTSSTCIIKLDDTIECWGPANFPQLSQEENNNIKFITQSRHSFSGANSCWITNNDSLFCRGNDSNMNLISVPLNNKKYKSASCGDEICCGLTLLGEIDCFGEESFYRFTSKLPNGYKYEKIDVSNHYAAGLTTCKLEIPEPVINKTEKLKLILENYNTTTYCVDSYYTDLTAKEYSITNINNFRIDLGDEVGAYDNLYEYRADPNYAYWNTGMCGNNIPETPFVVPNYTYYILINANINQSEWQTPNYCDTNCTNCDCMNNIPCLMSKFIYFINYPETGVTFGKNTKNNLYIYNPISANNNSIFEFSSNDAPSKFIITPYYFTENNLSEINPTNKITVYPTTSDRYSTLGCPYPNYDIINKGSTEKLFYSEILSKMISDGADPSRIGESQPILLKIEVSPFGWYEESIKHIIYNEDLSLESTHTLSVYDVFIPLLSSTQENRTCSLSECDCDCVKELTFMDERKFNIYVPCNEYGQSYSNCQ